MMTCSIIMVFLQLAVNGKTDNIFLMVSLRVCATAANKHKIWIKSSSKKRWQRLKLQSCISAELYRQTIMHASCSYRESCQKSSKVATSLARYSGFCMHLSSGLSTMQELCMAHSSHTYQSTMHTHLCAKLVSALQGGQQSEIYQLAMT